MVGPLNRKPISVRPAATRRTAVGLILGAPLLGACASVQSGQFSNPFARRSPMPGPPARSSSACGRHRAGQGRPDPAALGRRQCRRRRAVDEERRRDGAGGIPESQHPAPDQGRRRQPARRAAGHPAGARRRRGDHSGSAVRAVGSGDRAADARPRRLGDRVLDRFQRRRPRRLSAELPAGVRRQPDRRLCRRHRQSDPSRRCCPTTPTAMWWKPRSSRRSAARAAASSRSRNTAPIAPPPARTVAQSLGQADALFIADDGDPSVATADALTAAGANLRNIQLLGTGLWDNPRVFASPALQGGLYAAPDPSGFRSFSGRYRTKFGGEPVRTATLAYDAVALVAGAVANAGRAALCAGNADQPVRLCRHRRPVPLPLRRHQRARACGDEGRRTGGGTPVAGSPKSFGA